MYLETMEAIVSSPGLEKIILPKETGDRALPILPLGQAGVPSRSAPLPKASSPEQSASGAK